MEEHVYMYSSDCVEIAYELPLLPNHIARESFYTNREQCEVLTTGYLSLGCRPGGDWANNVTLDRTFYSSLFKQEAVAAPVTSTFSFVRIPRGSLY